MLTRLARLGALCAMAVLLAGCYTTDRDGGPVPPMEANRKVNEQSCTQGIDLTAGNLMCR
ncbi:MAG TPA: hypothetical protein VFK84_13340 [Burkholderiales bacterium]|nr:hypothetical protein [Burkholderiales bacterium]